MKSPTKISDTGDSSLWRATVYLENGQPIEAPGLHSHENAFAAGFELADRLKAEGKRPFEVFLEVAMP